MPLHLSSLLLLLFGTVSLCVSEPTAIEIALRTLGDAPDHYTEEMLLSKVEDIIATSEKTARETGGQQYMTVSALGTVTASARTASSMKRMPPVDLKSMISAFNNNPDHSIPLGNDDDDDDGLVSTAGAIIETHCMFQIFISLFSMLLEWTSLPKLLGDAIGKKIWGKLKPNTRNEIFHLMTKISDKPFDVADIMGSMMLKISQDVSFPGAITNELTDFWTWVQVVANLLAVISTAGLFYVAHIIDTMVTIGLLIKTIVGCVGDMVRYHAGSFGTYQFSHNLV